MPPAMRLAIVSDVHGDVEALRLALACIDRLGCVLVVCAGDVIHGAADEEVVALLRQRAIPCIRGNHERWALRAQEGAGRAPLSAASLEYLASLPTSWRALVGETRVAMHHASPKSDMDVVHPRLRSSSELQRFLEQADADVLLVGHSHEMFAVSLPGGRLLANPGALLRDLSAQPTLVSGRTSGGTFGILELPSRRFEWRQVPGGEPVSP